jgi:Tfp pilus assembly protein FimV
MRRWAKKAACRRAWKSRRRASKSSTETRLKSSFSVLPSSTAWPYFMRLSSRRRDFHARLQAAFFAQRRILGTEVYIVRRGDSLWSITQRYAGVPVWLLQQYNPDLELGALRTGVQLVVPRLEDAQSGVAAGR